MFGMKMAPFWINFNRSRRNLQNRCLQRRRKFESSFVQWKSKVWMDFVGGVFLKKLVEIRTDYFTVHITQQICISLRISRTADWRKGKSGRETVREGYVMNSWILYPGNNVLGHQSNTWHELHTCIDSHLTIVDRSVFVANCLDVLLRSNYI